MDMNVNGQDVDVWIGVAILIVISQKSTPGIEWCSAYEEQTYVNEGEKGHQFDM